MPDENIAAVCYGIGFLRNTAGEPLFYDRYSEELEGQIGVLRWLIDAAKEFTAAERVERRSFDWYLAIDGYLADIVNADGLLSTSELFESARRNIAANVEE